MIKRLKQMFCRHDYKFCFKVKNVNENVWRCKKCNKFYLQNYEDIRKESEGE